MTVSKKVSKGILLSSAACCAFVLSAKSEYLVEQACQQDNLIQPHISSSICYKPSNVSWLSWAMGNSRSAQFHFLDFMELLHRGDHDINNTSRPDRN